MTSIKVEVLKTVLVAEPGNLRGREIVKGTTDTVPDHLFNDLKGEGYVVEVGATSSAPAGSAVLRDDGPTVEQYVAAGYLASQYPPQGYVSRSTDEEIAAAIAVEQAKSGTGQTAASEEMTADLEKLTVAQLRDLAKDEKVELASDLNKAGIVEAIAAARAGAAKS